MALPQAIATHFPPGGTAITGTQSDMHSSEAYNGPTPWPTLDSKYSIPRHAQL